MRHLGIISLGTPDSNTAGHTKVGTETVWAEASGPLWHVTLVSDGHPHGQYEGYASETFQLSGTPPAIRRVNADLYKTVPTRPGNAEYFGCSMSALGQNGVDGGASSTLKRLL